MTFKFLPQQKTRRYRSDFWKGLLAITWLVRGQHQIV